MIDVFWHGMAMVVGGLKHRSQRFNPTSAGVTATLLFVSVAGRENLRQYTIVQQGSLFAQKNKSLLKSRRFL